MNFKQIIIFALIGIIIMPIVAMAVFAMDYTVKPGDTLYLLSKRYDTTVKALREANSLSTDQLRVGQEIIVPTAVSAMTVEQGFGHEEIELMAKAVYSEARGEPYTGQVAVAAVILNRLEHSDFPDTIKEVIFQPGAFSAINDGQFWLTPNAQAYEAVQDALKGWDPTGKAIYYWNPQTATNKWVWSRQIFIQIGKHVFAH